MRLTYRRRGGRWSANMIFESAKSAERKARRLFAAALWLNEAAARGGGFGA